MWIELSGLVLLVILGAAGITGIGVFDSRDARYSLDLAPGDDARPTHESMPAPQRRGRARTVSQTSRPQPR